MKAKLNNTILRYISRQINHGNALWGLLTANEYLLPDDPLRISLVRKTKESLQLDMNGYEHQGLIENILEGQTLNELPYDQNTIRSLIINFQEFSYSKQRKVPTMVPYHQRINTVARGQRKILNAR